MSGKTFVVTDGTSGLGLEVARLLVTDPSTPERQVVVLGDAEGEVSAVAADLECAGIVCDVTQYNQVQRTFDDSATRYGAIDGLAHLCGRVGGRPLHEVPLSMPRDRAGSFEPRLVPKASRRAGGLDEMIISLFAGWVG